MPEIAEREPKVISVWSVLFVPSLLGEVREDGPSSARSWAGGQSCTALVCARAEEMVLFTPS